MSYTPFRFKQFSVADNHSTLKVGTDAVLLGAWIDPKGAQRILDIGTGCGLIALMLAQKSIAHIDGIDIDAPSIEEAKRNFTASPWGGRLKAHHQSLQEYTLGNPNLYDIVVSNPPFFDNDLPASTLTRNKAKHTHHLSFHELCLGMATLLTDNGTAYLILPTTEAKKIRSMAEHIGLYAHTITYIQPTPTKEPNRWLMAFGKTKTATTISSLLLREEDNRYTNAYKKFTEGYYL